MSLYNCTNLIDLKKKFARDTNQYLNMKFRISKNTFLLEGNFTKIQYSTIVNQKLKFKKKTAPLPGNGGIIF